MNFDKVFVITVGKVGSANFLNCDYDLIQKRDVRHNHKLNDLKSVLKNSSNNLIIVGIRNPIDRNLSQFFHVTSHGHGEDGIKLEFSMQIKTRFNNYLGERWFVENFSEKTPHEKIIDFFFNNYDQRNRNPYLKHRPDYHNTFNEWFTEFLEITKINRFNKEKGVDFYTFPNNNTIMIYTTEKLNDNEKYICDLLKIKNFKNINKCRGKREILYKEIKNEICFPKEYLDKLLNTDIMRLFYSDEDINSFYSKYKVAG